MKKFWSAILLMMPVLLSAAFTSHSAATVLKKGNDFLPVLFIHGTSGSASQFESQAQRFMANGYPRTHLEAFEYDSAPFFAAAMNIAEFSALLYDPGFHSRINKVIDRLLAASGKKQVNLIGHSLGTFISNAFLKTGENAKRVAHYINMDGSNGRGRGTPFGRVKTLSLWGMQNTATNSIGETATDDHDDAQAHIELCTSAVSFQKMFRFMNQRDPDTTDIPEAAGQTVEIAGKANLFPENIGAAGTTLSIYEVNRDTGFPVSDTPVGTRWKINASGEWGPVNLTKGASYAFVLKQDTAANATHIFYREPFWADNYFIRLLTSRPNQGLSANLKRAAGHTILMICRDKEMWGDQGDANDVLLVDGTSVLTKETAKQSRRLSSLFLCDQNGSASNDFTVIPQVTLRSFIGGTDVFIPAGSPPDRTVSVHLKSRGGSGVVQTINVPNWPSSEVKTVSVQFRDFVRPKH